MGRVKGTKNEKGIERIKADPEGAAPIKRERFNHKKERDGFAYQKQKPKRVKIKRFDDCGKRENSLSDGRVNCRKSRIIDTG